MHELIAEIHEILGVPPRDRELIDAVEVALIKTDISPDLDDVLADLSNRVLAGLTRGRDGATTTGGQSHAGFNVRLAHAQQDAIDTAHEHLGISHHMVWALNRSHLFVFRRSLVGARPKELTGRHALRHLELVDVGHPAGGDDKTLTVTIHGLPITVAVDEEEVVRFATALQRLLRARPAPSADRVVEHAPPTPDTVDRSAETAPTRADPRPGDPVRAPAPGGLQPSVYDDLG